MELGQTTRAYFHELQDEICRGLERVDGKATFQEDRWIHKPEQAEGAGGGITRIIRDGRVFEKGGVNLSAVHGELSERLAERLDVPRQPFFATGVSLVLHPTSPMIPTVHMNVRYIELTGSSEDTPGSRGRAWYGGGADLTPSYLFEQDAVHFHRRFKTACDRHDPQYYPRFKKGCDDYFHIRHRGEARGIGGIFFDYLDRDLPAVFEFVKDVGGAFLEAYVPIVERRAGEPWSAPEKLWQEIRRGRYVEFNLIYDRGTLFGLETGGRTESILMSLPPTVRWDYAHEPQPGTREADLLQALRKPVDWI